MGSAARPGWTGVGMGLLLLLLLVLMLTSTPVDARRRHKRGDRKCSEEMMVQYQLTFHGDWAKSTFPKMYPRYRPKAQWSKLVGRSHGPEYELWSLGRPASPAVQQFAEEGSTVLLDAEAQGYNDTFDLFTAAPIVGGVGRTSTRVLLDGAHPRVSLMVKLVPSPDWFVGVSGFELCRHGRWKRKLAVNLRPVDAGTDKGLTYTSPNWPAVPRENIFEIRPDYPQHPASSFYDPKAKSLPRIARVVFERVVQYSKRGAKPVPRELEPNVAVVRQPHQIEEDQLTLPTFNQPPPVPELNPPTPTLELRPERVAVLLKDQSPTPGAAPLTLTRKLPLDPSVPPNLSVRVVPPTQASPTPQGQSAVRTPTLSLTARVIDPRPRLTADFSEEGAYHPSLSQDSFGTPTLTAESTEVSDEHPGRPKLTVGVSRYPDSSHVSAGLPEQPPTLSSVSVRRTTRLAQDGGGVYQLPAQPRSTAQQPLHALEVGTSGGAGRLVKLQASQPRYGQEEEGDTDHQGHQSEDRLGDRAYLGTQRQDALSKLHSPTVSAFLRAGSTADVEASETRRPAVSQGGEMQASSWSSDVAPTQRAAIQVGVVHATKPLQGYVVNVQGKDDGVEQDVTPRRDLHTHTPTAVRFAILEARDGEGRRESKPHVFNGEVEPVWDTSNLAPRRDSASAEAAQEPQQHERYPAPSARLSGPRLRPHPLPSQEPTEPFSTSRGGAWQVGGMAHDAAVRPRAGGEQDKEQDVLRDSDEVPALEQPRYHQLDDGSPQDCVVSAWSEWSSCSKTCGFGVRQRQRYMLQHPKHGGQPCPRLRTETVCGSMRNCRWDYFGRFFNRKQRHRRRLRHRK